MEEPDLECLASVRESPRYLLVVVGGSQRAQSKRWDANPVRDLLADDWRTAIDQGKLGRQELNSMKEKLEAFVGSLPKASTRRRSSHKKKLTAN